MNENGIDGTLSPKGRFERMEQALVRIEDKQDDGFKTLHEELARHNERLIELETRRWNWTGTVIASFIAAIAVIINHILGGGRF